MENSTSKGRGWHGDPEEHARVGAEGGQATSDKYGPEFYEEIGRKGGEASPTKFKKGDRRASEAGRRGGKSRATNNDNTQLDQE